MYYISQRTCNTKQVQIQIGEHSPAADGSVVHSFVIMPPQQQCSQTCACLYGVILSNDGISIFSDITPLHWSQLYEGMCVSADRGIKKNYSHIATIHFRLLSSQAIFDWTCLILSSVPMIKKKNFYILT